MHICVADECSDPSEYGHMTCSTHRSQTPRPDICVGKYADGRPCKSRPAKERYTCRRHSKQCPKDLTSQIRCSAPYNRRSGWCTNQVELQYHMCEKHKNISARIPVYKVTIHVEGQDIECAVKDLNVECSGCNAGADEIELIYSQDRLNIMYMCDRCSDRYGCSCC